MAIIFRSGLLREYRPMDGSFTSTEGFCHRTRLGVLYLVVLPLPRWQIWLNCPSFRLHLVTCRGSGLALGRRVVLTDRPTRRRRWTWDSAEPHRAIALNPPGASQLAHRRRSERPFVVARREPPNPLAHADPIRRSAPVPRAPERATACCAGRAPLIAGKETYRTTTSTRSSRAKKSSPLHV